MTRRVMRGSSAAHVRVVDARDDRAVERHLVGEVDERLLQVVEARRSSPGARGRCS